MSSDNPFDVFAADFKAAIPATDDKNGAGNHDQPAINIMAQPAPAPVPVMKAPVPVMTQQAPPAAAVPQMNGMGGGMMNMNGGMYGAGVGAGPGGGMMNMNGGYGGPPPPAMGGGMPMAMAAPGQNGMNPMNAMVPAAQPANPYAMNMNTMSPAPQMGQMGGQPHPMAMGQMGQPPVPGATDANAPPSPYGGMPGMYAQPAPVAPVFAAPVVAEAPVVPTSAPPAVPVPTQTDPFSPGAPPVQPPQPPQPFAPAPTQLPPAVPQPPNVNVDVNDPWGQPAPPAANNDALVPVPNGAPNSDPFGVFDQPDALSVATPAGPTNTYTQEQINQAADDPWNSTPFGSAPTNNNNNAPVAAAPPAMSGDQSLLGDDALVPAGAAGAIGATGEEHKSGELPPGGEWYDARIFTPTLGVMFFKPQELNDSLFLQTDRSLVEALDDRPVVAFIVEGSSARAAGVELGHVLLKVNGIDVKNPKEASRLIKEGPRPLPLLFYVPDTTVVVAEGEHMVKYDTRDTTAPNSAKDWKPKYVVIGGIIAQPWMMNMYRSKSEYDIAVIETQARRPVSVKVKQFSLQGSRIQNDWQGPQMVKYKNKLHPWKYIVILPISRNPIKISSPNLVQLKPVHEGIRRVLMVQNRHAPVPSRGDPYGQQQGGGDGYSQPPPQHGGGGNYSQPPPHQQPVYNQPPPQQQPVYNQPPPQHGGGNYSQPPPQQQPGYGPPPGDQYGGGPPQQQGGYDSYNTAGGTGSVRRRTQY